MVIYERGREELHDVGEVNGRLCIARNDHMLRTAILHVHMFLYISVSCPSCALFCMHGLGSNV